MFYVHIVFFLQIAIVSYNLMANFTKIYTYMPVSKINNSLRCLTLSVKQQIFK